MEIAGSSPARSTKHTDMKQFIINVPDSARFVTLHISVKEDAIQVTDNRYMDAVCRLFGVTAEDIAGERVWHPLPMARKQLALLLCMNTKLSIVQIGKLMNRDHSTVVYMLKRSKELIEINDHLFLETWNILQYELPG